MNLALLSTLCFQSFGNLFGRVVLRYEKKKKKKHWGLPFYSVQSCLSVIIIISSCAMLIPKMGALQSAELSYNIREVSIGCRSTVPSSLPSCLPPLRSHTGTPRLIQAEGEFTQTSNCSDRRALVCDSRAAVARKGRQAVREAGGSTGKQAEGYTVGETRRRRLGPPGRHVSSV